ncbi:MAG: M56 family metallopeptidase, partial [Planctomycetota bacterium]|nr:M56 family metallopeptidase [Planctomycetota bacterium]
MNAIIETSNAAGRAFVEFALPMFIQSSVLILILLAVDLLLRRRVRAVFRYWIWMLVLVKLVLPPSLGSPISIGAWLGETLEPPQIAVDEPLAPQPQMPPLGWQPQVKLGDGRPVVVDHIREMQTSAP